MADNITLNPGTGGELIATDELTTVNGAAAPTGLKVQRVKLGFGVDGDLKDVSAADRLPVDATGSTVSLDGPSLAALENITVGGSVELGAASLAALENVTVGGTVELGATSLAALETVSVSGVATETTLATLASVVKAEDSAAAEGDPGLVIFAQRRDTDAAAVSNDGDYSTLKSDDEGRLKVSTKPASFALVTGAITASAQTAFCDVSRASNVMISMVAASLTGHNVTFEGSIDSTNGTDGNWFGIQVIRSNANTIELTSGVLAATPAYAWEASVNGLSFVRVRATAHTGGTATYKFQRGSYATEPIPAAQISGTQPISGSVTATLAAATVRAAFVAGAGIWYDDSSTNLAANATFTGTSRDATVTATATAFANAATYAQEVRLSAESDVTGTLWLEVSRDNTNWRRVKSVATAAVSGGGFYAEIVHRPSWRYWRAGYTNGATIQARFTLNSVATAL